MEDISRAVPVSVVFIPSISHQTESRSAFVKLTPLGSHRSLGSLFIISKCNLMILKNTKCIRKCGVPPLLAPSPAPPTVVRFGYYDNRSGSRREEEEEGLFQAEADGEREERDSD